MTLDARAQVRALLPMSRSCALYSVYSANARLLLNELLQYTHTIHAHCVLQSFAFLICLIPPCALHLFRTSESIYKLQSVWHLIRGSGSYRFCVSGICLNPQLYPGSSRVHVRLHSLPHLAHALNVAISQMSS
jgi:hypothetical protein